MNTDQTQTVTGPIFFLLKWGSLVSDLFFQGGLDDYLWFVCVLVVTAARSDYCSQTTGSIHKAKVPLKFKLKNYNIVCKWKCFWCLAICYEKGCRKRLNEYPATKTYIICWLYPIIKCEMLVFFSIVKTYICFYIYTYYIPHDSIPASPVHCAI